MQQVPVRVNSMYMSLNALACVRVCVYAPFALVSLCYLIDIAHAQADIHTVAHFALVVCRRVDKECEIQRIIVSRNVLTTYLYQYGIYHLYGCNSKV